jgi:multimeric flavodoxin WrbA
MRQMSKKVLVISASPRMSGNSDLLCDQFVKGAQESGLQTEKIFLKEKRINYCTGCGFCSDRKKGCSQKDDMAEILQKIVEADVIVMATPVYFYTMSGQMKTFIDRCCARYTEIRGKDFYFIVTAADDSIPNMHRTLEEFRGFTACLDSPIEKGVIYGVGVWNRGEVVGKPAMKQAYEMGKAV